MIMADTTTRPDMQELARIAASPKMSEEYRRARLQSEPERLQRMVAAASAYMLDTDAEELCRNVYTGLEQLDADGACRFERWAYVRASIEHRQWHWQLKCSDVEACASAIVRVS